MENNWNELIGDFLDEAYSLLESLEDSLLKLEKDPKDKDGIDTVFRVAHTIKGGAGAVGFTDISKLTHIMEDLLELVRQGQYIFTDDDISLLLNVKDELETLLKAHEQKKDHPFDQAARLIQQLEHLKQIALKPKSVNTSEKKEIIPEVVDNPESKDFMIDHLPMAARFGLTHDLLSSIQEALNYEEPLLFIEIRFNEEYELKEVGPFEILNIINGIAEPIIMNPSPESLDEEYIPFLNVVISSHEQADYVQNKLFLPEVVTSVVVTALSEELYSSLEKSMQYYNEVPQVSTIITENIANVKKSIPIETLPAITPIEPVETPEEAPVQQVNKIESVKSEEKRTLKVESSRIDELLNLLGELVIIRSGLNQFAGELERSVYQTRLNLRSFLNSNELIPLHDDQEMNKQRNDQFKEDFSVISSRIDHFVEYIQQLSRISSTLQIRMMNLRMVPVQTVFSRFTRLTRDIAKQLDKKIELVMEGGETEIDKGMIDDLYDPLMHMIRNSLDHGIETPQERITAGKDETGLISLKAYQEGDSIFIEISDNGKGINADKIAEKALAKGFITESQLMNFSTQEKLSLIFLPGFSTAEQISNLSGRGVGMDVVHRTIQELGGSVSIFSDLGKGSTIRIQLPLTLAIIQGLLIVLENVHYVIPITLVEETIILKDSILNKLDHYYAIKFREKLIPLISLSNVLYHIDSFQDQEQELEVLKHQYCIIVRFGSRQVGIIVPEILKEQDIVVKPLDNRLISSPGISAATIVGNGEIGFILDIPQIIRYYLHTQQITKE
ncbi:MAG: chemotaxis protein CheA [Brevinema sp.]